MGCPYLGCPDCGLFEGPVVELRRWGDDQWGPDAPNIQPPRVSNPDACAECNRIVVEAPSPIKALAGLVINRTHRKHVPERADQLPF